MTKKQSKLQISAKTDVGREREQNEDNIIVAPRIDSEQWFAEEKPFVQNELGSVIAVADGMGGANAGEVASEIAIKSIKEEFSKLDKDKVEKLNIKAYMKECLLIADAKIKEHMKDNPETNGMGTTIVLSWILNGTAHISWCGDSRAYVYTEGKGLKLITKDHSYVQGLVDDGKITYEQSFYHPDNNVITQHLGMTDKKPKPDYTKTDLASGDKLLLCSDGLNGMLPDERIEEILAEGRSTKETVNDLIHQANEEGGYDNISVILCKAQQTPHLRTADNQPPHKKKSKRTKWYVMLAFLALASISLLFIFDFNNTKKTEKNAAIKEETDTARVDTTEVEPNKNNDIDKAEEEPTKAKKDNEDRTPDDPKTKMNNEQVMQILQEIKKKISKDQIGLTESGKSKDIDRLRELLDKSINGNVSDVDTLHLFYQKSFPNNSLKLNELMDSLKTLNTQQAQ